MSNSRIERAGGQDVSEWKLVPVEPKETGND